MEWPGLVFGEYEVIIIVFYKCVLIPQAAQACETWSYLWIQSCRHWWCFPYNRFNQNKIAVIFYIMVFSVDLCSKLSNFGAFMC